MEKAILYLRVSSKGQEDNYSLDAQEKLGYEYAKKNNLKIVKLWRGAESAWGKKERRKFNQMLEYGKKHTEIKHFIFDILDRMTRNDSDKIKIITMMKDFDKTIHFSRTNKVYSKHFSPDDEFMLDIEVAVSKKLSNDISRKTKMGMTEKAEQGIYPSATPLGYINNKITKGIEPDQIRAPLIKKLFEMTASKKYSLRMLEDELYNMGLRTKKNKRVNKSTLCPIIHNPIFYGDFRWKGKLYKGNHTPIVSKDLWEKANKTLSGAYRPYITKKDYAFSNTLRCYECNCTVLAGTTRNKPAHKKSSKQYTYYRCSFSKGIHKHEGNITEADLADKVFLPVISNVTIGKDITDLVQEAVKYIANEQSTIKENKKQTLEQELKETTLQIKRLYELQLHGKVSNFEIFGETERNLTEREQNLKSELVLCGIDEQTVVKQTEVIFPVLNELEDIYKESSYHDKAIIIKELCDVSLLKGKKIIPNYRQPYNFFAQIKKDLSEHRLNMSDLKSLKEIDFTIDCKKGSKDIIWGGRRDLNSQPSAPQTDALTS